MPEYSNGDDSGPALLLQRNVDLQPLNTLRTPAKAAYFCHAESVAQAQQAIQFAAQEKLKVLVLGAGSNVFFTADVNGLVLQLGTTEVEVLRESETDITIRAEGGANWNAFVHHTLDQHWFGLENLALIPGSVGAAPVQNIGAYGVEQDQYCVAVEVLDTTNAESQILAAEDCQFAYRQSRFKLDWAGRFLITAVHYQLSKQARVNTAYSGINEQLEREGIANPTPEDIAAVVSKIRSSKLPDPELVPNAGSFFKNPIVSQEKLERLREQYPNLPSYVLANSRYEKLPAAWLIESLGWKGKQVGEYAVHQQQALVVTNCGQGSGAGLVKFSEQIRSSVKQHFDVELEQEVRALP